MRLFVATCFLLTACGSIQQQAIISTPTNRSLVAGVGDVILRVEGRESMPNAFGRADIFGRTRPTGFTTIQYGGLQGGKVVLLRNGAVTQSNATTMNSTPLLVPSQQNTNISGVGPSGSFSANANTQGLTYIPPTGSTAVSSQQPMIPVYVDWRQNPRVPALGRMIVIETATSVALTYHIE